MLFGKRKQVVKRILIVEDEPLTAFDNENMLGDAGYEIVATVDDLNEALEVLEREEVDLILSDVRLRSQQTGIDLAHAAKENAASRPCSQPATPTRRGGVAVGCLMKPYSERQLSKAIEMRRPPSAGGKGEAAQGPRAVRRRRRGEASRLLASRTALLTSHWLTGEGG